MSAHRDSLVGPYVSALENIDHSGYASRPGLLNGWDVARPPLHLIEPADRDTPLLSPPSRAYCIVKRTIDIAGSFVLLLALAPLFVLLALAVKRSSPGGVLFVQTRVGKDMRPFRCLKFRTMVDNAELVLLENPQLRDALTVSWKLHEDPRTTKVGRIMRKTSLDELPQLWNVLMGEMSLIGPRPVQFDEIAQKYGSYGPTVMSAKPGMTGLWQVSGRSNTTYEERVRLDVEYVNQACLLMDFRIILRTIPILITRSGAT